MTKIKFCGLTRACDIEYANALLPDYAGFVFFPKSKRYVNPDSAADLRKHLDSRITPVGVFVNEKPENIAYLINSGVIDIAQLHGDEDEDYIKKLRTLTEKPIIQAFRISDKSDVERAESSSADMVLLDSQKGGSGECFDWSLLKDCGRDYFLAGGLNCSNAERAVRELNPFAVDVSSGIEENGVKSFEKMKLFLEKIRN
ncbi:MAG: phosphoribosylanthranilate isomerase [Clostridiales bacterium]|nr:phosphoribosylanthranilate isomerase [Clostridiales bacterium]